MIYTLILEIYLGFIFKDVSNITVQTIIPNFIKCFPFPYKFCNKNILSLKIKANNFPLDNIESRYSNNLTIIPFAYVTSSLSEHF